MCHRLRPRVARARALQWPDGLIRNLMAKIEQSIIDRVLENTDIVEVIGGFVDLKRKGARYIGLCPFHEDRHATNFVVYPAKHCYKCFACDAKGDVVKFLMDNQGMSFVDAIRYLGEKAKIDVDGVAVTTDVKVREAPPPLPTLYLPSDMVRHSMQRSCNFHMWLHSLPWTDEQRARIEKVLEEYCVGATKQGFALFWQLDETGTARTGHCMKYQDDGHRVKKGYCIDWIHTILRKQGTIVTKDDKQVFVPKYPEYAADRCEMRQTLFGMHLLSKYPGADVHIEESEKTALIMAIYFGNDSKNVWMACSGKYNLTAERLKPIIDQRRVIALHPDKDGMDDWREKMSALDYKWAYINDTIIRLQWVPEDGEKADDADIIIRDMYARQRGKTRRLEDVMSIVPAVRLLKDKFELKEETK